MQDQTTDRPTVDMDGTEKETSLLTDNLLDVMRICNLIAAEPARGQQLKLLGSDVNLPVTYFCGKNPDFYWFKW